MENGIETELDALKELIDIYTDSLDSAKDLYDYQKKIEEKTQNIASLQKQLSAYEKDTSEETKTKIQKLKVELEEAQEDLKETEYDKFVSDTKKLLDDLYNEYENIMNMRLDNIDALLSDMINMVNANAGSINETLTAESDKVGYTLTEAMKNIWNSDNAAGSIVGVMQMKAVDFEYDGLTLSGFGFMICDFNGGGSETVSNGSEITFHTEKTLNGTQYHLFGATYDTCLEATFQICKDICTEEPAPITTDEIRLLSRWLNRKNFRKLKFLDEEFLNFYTEASFNINLIKFDGLVYGLELTMITNRPFLLQEPQHIIINNTSKNGKHIFLSDSDEENELNFENYLGKDLWFEFCSYKREDLYSNSNYISDGLTDSEIFDKAQKFIKIAKEEIFKSAEFQHSISTNLKNLLVIKKFKPLVDKFKVGNWLRIQVDDIVYKLRLLSYEVDFDSLENLSVEFSDVMKTANGLTDQKNLMQKAASMASSYDATKRQAEQGKKSKEQLNDWVNKGLSLTNMKIVGNADNQNQTWDSHGILCREYSPITDTYDNRQLKIINRGLYVTDDNWLTSKAGIGNFTFWNPETQKMDEAYGVIADTLVGNLILSEKVGIYNQQNSITLNNNGIIITSNNTNKDINKNLLTIQKKSNENEEPLKLMYIDDNSSSLFIISSTVGMVMLIASLILYCR